MSKKHKKHKHTKCDKHLIKWLKIVSLLADIVLALSLLANSCGLEPSVTEGQVSSIINTNSVQH